MIPDRTMYLHKGTKNTKNVSYIRFILNMQISLKIINSLGVCSFFYPYSIFIFISENEEHKQKTCKNRTN